MNGPLVYTPDRYRALVDACYDDFPRFAFDGFGVMLTDEQLEARVALGAPGPRKRGEHKTTWVSGGQRSGKTVEAALYHADACLYKRGVDGTSRAFWKNYLYGTLAAAPTTDLTLRLWTIMDELSKGAHEAQFDRKARRSRGGAFIAKLKAGKQDQWPIIRYANGAVTDFRSTEGFAYRLEGGQWWYITWDEWASQPEREIDFVLTDVLMGRARDHDAKIMPMAWPKPETERHIVKVIRAIEKGEDTDSQVVYLDASKAFFTNKAALDVELRRKSSAQVQRTIRGRPAGGAGIEFKDWMLDNLFDPTLRFPVGREDGYRYLCSWDLGLGHDSTVGVTWRIPVVNGKRIVSPLTKARIVNYTEIAGGPSLSPDTILDAIRSEQEAYGAQVVVDATGLGGLMAVRGLRELGATGFVSRANDRIWGNMRLAAITNGLDVLTWERVDGLDRPWGLIESGHITPLRDNMASFDRDDTKFHDDPSWAFLIGAWYIRRWWAVGDGKYDGPRPFDVRVAVDAPPSGVIVTRRKRGRLIRPVLDDLPLGPAVATSGVRVIRPAR